MMVWKIDDKRVAKDMTFFHKRYRKDKQCLILKVRNGDVTFCRVNLVQPLLRSSSQSVTVSADKFEALFDGWGETYADLMFARRQRTQAEYEISQVYPRAVIENALFDVGATQGAVAVDDLLNTLDRAIEIARDQGRLDAYDDAYTEGKSDGYHEGHSDGRREGFDDGWSAARD